MEQYLRPQRKFNRKELWMWIEVLWSGSLVSQNGNSSSTALVVRVDTVENRLETLASKGESGAPPEDRMAIDGPTIGPSLVDSGVSPIEKAIQNEAGGLPAVPRFEEPNSSGVETNPALEEKINPNTETQKQRMPISQTTPTKKSGRKWKRAARGGEQIQQVGRITSPMQRMLMAGKVGKKTPKSHTSPKLSSPSSSSSSLSSSSSVAFFVVIVVVISRPHLSCQKFSCFVFDSLRLRCN
ncbi:hypothetical protein Q3G72_035108 [Acer saccharum]|nr:hypothetical protein Q3G72_035108 [Acer saccharum]